METPLLQWLKDHFSNTSKEVLKSNWEEIETLDLKGPTCNDYIHYIDIYNSNDCSPPEENFPKIKNNYAPDYTEHLFLYRFAQ